MDVMEPLCLEENNLRILCAMEKASVAGESPGKAPFPPDLEMLTERREK